MDHWDFSLEISWTVNKRTTLLPEASYSEPVFHIVQHYFIRWRYLPRSWQRICNKHKEEEEFGTECKWCVADTPTCTFFQEVADSSDLWPLTCAYNRAASEQAERILRCHIQEWTDEPGGPRWNQNGNIKLLRKLASFHPSMKKTAVISLLGENIDHSSTTTAPTTKPLFKNKQLCHRTCCVSLRTHNFKVT